MNNKINIKKEWLCFVNEILTSFKFSLKDIIIFPDENINTIITYVSIISFVSLICKLFKFPFLLDYRGGILALMYLLIFKLYLRRCNKNEIFRINGDSNADNENIESREERPNNDDGFKTNITNDTADNDKIG